MRLVSLVLVVVSNAHVQANEIKERHGEKFTADALVHGDELAEAGRFPCFVAARTAFILDSAGCRHYF